MSPDDRLLAVLQRSRDLGFLGPGPLEVQLAHAEGFAAGIAEPPTRWLDLGTGGGVPGLVLAGVWPESMAVLLDSAERRTDFLADVVVELGWSDRVRVVRLRAEEAGRRAELRGGCDLVVARGFGPPGVTAECAAPLLRVGGCLVVSEPPEPAPEMAERWPADGLGLLGLVPAERWHEPFQYRSFRLARPCPEAYPRRVGVPGKRPLF